MKTVTSYPARYARRKVLGLCPHCKGEVKAIAGRMLCEFHYKWQKEYQAKRNQENREQRKA